MNADTFEKIWIGSDYAKSPLKLLVLGWSRYDEGYTDEQIVQSFVDGERKHTFTRFTQAAIGIHHSDPTYDAVAFWKRTMFCNYERSFLPGGPRLSPRPDDLINVQNQDLLRGVIRKHRPTHCVVWWKCNWSNVEAVLQKNDERYLIVDEHKTLFEWIVHPSSSRFQPLESKKRLADFLRI